MAATYGTGTMRYLIFFFMAWLFVSPPPEAHANTVDPAKGGRRIESRTTRHDHSKDSAYSQQQQAALRGAWYAQVQQPGGDGPAGAAGPDSSTPAFVAGYPAPTGFSLAALQTLRIPPQTSPDEPVFSPARPPLPVEAGPPLLI